MLLPLPSPPLPSPPPVLSVVESYGVWKFITTLSASSGRQSIPPPPSEPGITIILMSPIRALTKSSSNFILFKNLVNSSVVFPSVSCVLASVLGGFGTKLSLIINVSNSPVVEFGAWKNHFDSTKLPVYFILTGLSKNALYVPSSFFPIPCSSIIFFIVYGAGISLHLVLIILVYFYKLYSFVLLLDIFF